MAAYLLRSHDSKSPLKAMTKGDIAEEFDADTVQLSGSVQDNTVIRSKTLEVKLSTQEGKMEVVFGNTNLSVGGDPAEPAPQAEPAADRSDAGDDLCLAALGLHVHAGWLRKRAAGLLDREQHHHLRAAVHDHVDARQTAGPVRQHQGRVQAGQGRREGYSPSSPAR